MQGGHTDIRFCHNAKTGEIFSYSTDGEWSYFPRGTWLAYGDYLTTGLKSQAEAEAWAAEWHACLSCKGARRGQPGDLCVDCRTPLVAGELA